MPTWPGWAPATALLQRRREEIVVRQAPRWAQEAEGARNLFSVLAPGGRAIVLVPQGPGLYGTLDRVLGHERRYTEAMLRDTLENAGFAIERMFDFNRASRPGWWWNGTLLKRDRFSRVQLKALDWMIWLIRRIDRGLPWHGVSLIAIARRPAKSGSSSGWRSHAHGLT